MSSVRSSRMPDSRPPKRRRPADGNSEKSGFVRYFVTPLGWITAVVTALAAVIGLAGAWPETWWPRQIPAVAVGLDAGENSPSIYAVTSDAAAITSPPPPDSPEGCNSAERHKWAQRLEGFPQGSSTYFLVLTALRTSTTVVVTDFHLVARRVPGRFRTGLVLCGQDFGSGGADYPFQRTVEVELSNKSKADFSDGTGKALARPTVVLNQGDVVQYQIRASTSEEEMGEGRGYEWYGEFSISVNGEVQQLRVPKEGYFRLADLTDSAVLWSDTVKPNICDPRRIKNAWCE